MKTFKYANGNIAGQTLTVQELIEELQKYDGNLPVMATWEGVNSFVDPNCFYIRPVSKGYKQDACQCLVIDVEAY